jgi:hypothetical protein
MIATGSRAIMKTAVRCRSDVATGFPFLDETRIAACNMRPTKNQSGMTIPVLKRITLRINIDAISVTAMQAIMICG